MFGIHKKCIVNGALLFEIQYMYVGCQLCPRYRGSETGTAGTDTGILSRHSGGGQCRQALLNKETLGFISVLVGVGVWGELVWGPEKGSWGNKV